jgi:hypothetical protein
MNVMAIRKTAMHIFRRKQERQKRPSGQHPWNVVKAGRLRASVWKNKREDGSVNYAITLTRLIRGRDEGDSHFSSRLYPENLFELPLLLKRLAEELVDETALPPQLRRSFRQLAHCLTLVFELDEDEEEVGNHVDDQASNNSRSGSK